MTIEERSKNIFCWWFGSFCCTYSASVYWLEAKWLYNHSLYINILSINKSYSHHVLYKIIIKYILHMFTLELYFPWKNILNSSDGAHASVVQNWLWCNKRFRSKLRQIRDIFIVLIPLRAQRVCGVINWGRKQMIRCSQNVGHVGKCLDCQNSPKCHGQTNDQNNTSCLSVCLGSFGCRQRDVFILSRELHTDTLLRFNGMSSWQCVSLCVFSDEARLSLICFSAVKATDQLVRSVTLTTS